MSDSGNKEYLSAEIVVSHTSSDKGIEINNYSRKCIINSNLIGKFSLMYRIKLL